VPPRLRSVRTAKVAPPASHEERAVERERDYNRAAAPGYEATNAAASRLRGGLPAPTPLPSSPFTWHRGIEHCPAIASARAPTRPTSTAGLGPDFRRRAGVPDVHEDSTRVATQW
jgi:hypothetical protein